MARLFSVLFTASSLLSATAAQPNDDNPHYRVSFNDSPVWVFSHPCQGQDARCGSETNNFASYTLQPSSTNPSSPSSPSSSFVPVLVTATSLQWGNRGNDVNVRPSYLVESGVVSNITSVSVSGNSKTISFTVSAPCQLSIEIGDENLLFPNENSYYDFSNLMLFFNPPTSSWPHAPPSLASAPGKCSSGGGAGRNCILATAASSCGVWNIPPNTDLFFANDPALPYTFFQWGDGCGVNPQQIRLGSGARVFLDDRVVVYARILADAGASAAGIFGYGIVSNIMMKGVKDPNTSNVLDLQGKNSQILGPIVLDSTYRNIELGGNGTLSYSKSFAWNSETDCVNLLSSGGRVSNNFFKNNDDCMKAYQTDTIYKGNTVWHQDVGRALMFSWGNLNEAENTDGSVQFIDTYVIHDKLGFRTANALSPQPPNAALGWQAGMIYYSPIICVEHSPSNHIGTPSSPVLIRNLRLETRIGSIILISNGYAELDNKAPWMGTDGCTGGVNMLIDGLDLSKLTGTAAPSVVGGCNIDGSYGGVANANCICTTSQGCSTGQCGIALTVKNLVDSTQPNVTPFQKSLIGGDNTQLNWR